MGLVIPAGEPNRGPALMNLSIALLVLITFMTMIRVLSKIITKQRWWFDDLFALLSWALSVIMFALTIVSISKLGFGLHEETITAQDVSYAIRGAKYFYAGMFTFNGAVILPKISALFFYARVFNTKNRTLLIHLWVLGLSACGWLFSVCLVTIWQCHPIRRAWNPTVPGKCINGFAFYTVTAVISCAIDIWILAIPVPLILGLKSSLRRRIYLLVAFFLTYSVIVASIGRLIVAIQIIPTYAEDMTWRMPIYMYWALMESSLSVISISVPNAIALVRHFQSRSTNPSARTDKSSKFTSSYELNGSQNYTSIRGGGASIGEHSDRQELVGAEQDNEMIPGSIRILTKIRVH